MSRLSEILALIVYAILLLALILSIADMIRTCGFFRRKLTYGKVHEMMYKFLVQCGWMNGTAGESCNGCPFNYGTEYINQCHIRQVFWWTSEYDAGTPVKPYRAKPPDGQMPKHS